MAKVHQSPLIQEKEGVFFYTSDCLRRVPHRWHLLLLSLEETSTKSFFLMELFTRLCLNAWSSSTRSASHFTLLAESSTAFWVKQWHNQRSANYASDQTGAGWQNSLTYVQIYLWCSTLVNCQYPVIGGISLSMLLPSEHPHNLAPVSNFFPLFKLPFSFSLIRSIFLDFFRLSLWTFTQRPYTAH